MSSVRLSLVFLVVLVLCRESGFFLRIGVVGEVERVFGILILYMFWRVYCVLVRWDFVLLWLGNISYIIGF